MALQEGEILQQRYHIRKVVKSGGMGSVYLAHDANLDGPCAVKEMHPTDDSWVTRRFREEATLLSTLQHASIPRVRDFFQLERAGGQLCYIVMDFISGNTLHHELETAIKEGKPGLTATRAREIAVAMLGVLEYLHSLSPPIIHRDIKPANIICEEGTGRLFLVDFGLARGTSEHTQTTAGTLMFCPPEQMLGKADHRSDLYALGATLYLLLTGQPIQMGRYLPVMSHLPRLEPQLADTVDKVLQLDPDERFANARAMRDFLTGPYQAPASKVAPGQPPAWAPWLGGGAGILLCVVLIFQPWVRPKPPLLSPSPVALAAATPKLSTVSALPTWGVRETLTEAGLSEAYMRLWKEVSDYARAHEVSGLSYVRYHAWNPPSLIDMEVGIVLPEPRKGEGRIQSGELPGGSVATLTHVGRYERLPERFVQLSQWMASQSLKPGPGPYALYRITAANERDPEKWQTEVVCPILK